MEHDEINSEHNSEGDQVDDILFEIKNQERMIKTMELPF